MPVGDISPVCIIKAPKALVKDVAHWVHQRHANFMASSHHQSGENKLNFYTTAQSPVLKNDKDLASGTHEDGSEWVVFTEYYTNLSGLLDHWGKGQASGMLPDFMSLMGEGKSQPQFIQPLKIIYELNHLTTRPKAAVSDLSGATQLLVMFTVPKEHVAEAQKMLDDHAKWMTELHQNHKMLGRDIEFSDDEKLLYYSVGTCPVLNNHMDLDSGPDPEGKVIFLFTEYYKTLAGLERQWVHAREMAEAKGPDFTLGQMTALEAKGMKTTFIQPLGVKASVNWFDEA